MYPARIEEYVRPHTIGEALAAVARYDEGDAIFLAGGQSVMQAIKSRMLRPQCVVDLQAIPDLVGITNNSDGLRIGAMTRYVDIAASRDIEAGYRALQDAAGHVGDRQVRNRGTIGGSLCWNYLASCTPAVVLGLGGQINLVAADGSERSLVADDFLLGPLETARRDDEILVSVNWPAAPPRSGSCYRKWGVVKDALPVVGVCVAVTLDQKGLCTTARIALAGLADGAQRAPAGESALLGSSGAPGEIDAAMTAITNVVETHSDQSADGDYRGQLIRSLGREVAAQAFARARGQA